MLRSKLYRAVLSAAAMMSGPAFAQGAVVSSRPVQFQKLIDCRSVADPAARLACFDRESASIETAERNRELVIVDRGEIRKTRRSLFGLAMPRIPFLDDGDTEAAPVRIEGVVRSASVNREMWTVNLGDSVWRTTESAQFQEPPKAGEKVMIRRGALGSFVLKVENKKGLRAIRVR